MQDPLYSLLTEQKVLSLPELLRDQRTKLLEATRQAEWAGDRTDTCTYDQGYITQAVYACATCNVEAGMCLGCAMTCHISCDVLELFAKRHFRCDCGNEKFLKNNSMNANSSTLKAMTVCCTLSKNKDPTNPENRYNHNFSGLYCYCNQPYIDGQDTMHQCFLCQDWFHRRCLKTAARNEFRKDVKNLRHFDEDECDFLCSNCLSNPDLLILAPYIKNALFHQDSKQSLLPLPETFLTKRTHGQMGLVSSSSLLPPLQPPPPSSSSSSSSSVLSLKSVCKRPDSGRAKSIAELLLPLFFAGSSELSQHSSSSSSSSPSSPLTGNLDHGNTNVNSGTKVEDSKQDRLSALDIFVPFAWRSPDGICICEASSSSSAATSSSSSSSCLQTLTDKQLLFLIQADGTNDDVIYAGSDGEHDSSGNSNNNNATNQDEGDGYDDIYGLPDAAGTFLAGATSNLLQTLPRDKVLAGMQYTNGLKNFLVQRMKQFVSSSHAPSSAPSPSSPARSSASSSSSLLSSSSSSQACPQTAQKGTVVRAQQAPTSPIVTGELMREWIASYNTSQAANSQARKRIKLSYDDYHPDLV